MAFLRLRIATIVALVVGVGACHKTFTGHATQPNPLVSPTETLRESEPITIVTGDMELTLPKAAGTVSHGNLYVSERYPLRNVARFTVVSRDRLRFHVQIEHKWLEYVNLNTWNAYIVDDQGRTFRPERVERVRDKHVVYMWDQEVRGVARTHGRRGDIVAVHDDAHLNRQPLGSLSVWRGRGDFVFYRRDIFTPEMKSLKLVVERSGLAFAFVWHFTDETIRSDAASAALAQ